MLKITIICLAKSTFDGKRMLNFAKYIRETIKEGKCNEWKSNMFDDLMTELRLDVIAAD